ncbi:permease prefix domain 1-containing protein [Micromonospora sp. NPDC049081]|uniref:permease prefix domain 1-containing protein n=1 Tax=Micromonospora sp. NPDC049081 TaxID=3155150 RepID=UPI0033EB9F65
MRACDEVGIDERLRDLESRLHGPTRLRTELIREVRDALDDAAEAYRDGGLPAREAERRAVVDFGSPAELAPAYQAELAAGTLRGLARRALVIAVLLAACGDLTWQGSSWSGGPPPPAGYQVLAGSMHGIWLTVAAVALAALVSGRWAARRGRAGTSVNRLLGWGLTGTLALGAVAGVALFGWSIALWEAALTWPPMIVGAVLAGAAHFALFRATRFWLVATR